MRSFRTATRNIIRTALVGSDQQLTHSSTALIASAAFRIKVHRDF
jgi:hypothetical protein